MRPEVVIDCRDVFPYELYYALNRDPIFQAKSESPFLTGEPPKACGTSTKRVCRTAQTRPGSCTPRTPPLVVLQLGLAFLQPANSGQAALGLRRLTVEDCRVWNALKQGLRIGYSSVSNYSRITIAIATGRCRALWLVVDDKCLYRSGVRHPSFSL